MNSEKSIELLNSLLQLNTDRIAGYRNALAETDDEELKTLFKKKIQTSQQCQPILITEIAKMNGIILLTHSDSKFLHAITDHNTAWVRRNAMEILKSCEAGENIAVKAYENAIENFTPEISTKHQIIVRDQFQLIRNDHKTIKKLCDRQLPISTTNGKKA